MSNQLKPLTAPYEPEVAEMLARYPQQSGYLLSLFRTFANSPRFLKKAVPNLLDKESPLDLRTREIVILHVTAARNCEYEWGVHVSIFAKAARLNDDQVASSRNRGPAGWTAKEDRLIAAIMELCENGSLGAEALKGFQSDWNLEEQLEILALIGTYTTISLVANVAKLEPEAFAAHFPDGPK